MNRELEQQPIDHESKPGGGRTCTCAALAQWVDWKYRHEVADLPPRPAECRIHPIQTTMGDVMVSTIMRESSAVHYRGWYEETMVFHLTREGKQVIDQCDHHFEAVRKWFGGDIAVYEAGWREVSDREGRIHAIDVADALNVQPEEDE